MRASLLELSLRLAILQHKIGSLWRHKRGDVYQITGVVIQEKDGDPAFTYRKIIGEGSDLGVVFTRPVWEWSEPRFTLLREDANGREL
jgi:hypothetical protein